MSGRRPPPISRAFVAAALLAISVVLQDYKSAQAWSTAIGIIVAAVSGGVRKTEHH